MDCVLFLAPMRSELRPIVKLLDARRLRVADEVVYAAIRDGRMLVTATIGVGPAMARRSTRRLLDALDADRVVVSGIAGGIDGSLSVGTVVLPEFVVDVATGAQYRPHPSGQSTGNAAAGGGIGTVDQLLLDDERLDRLVKRGIVAVDMETAAVAEVCEERSREWSVVRCISDRPQDGMVDDAAFQVLNEDGTTNPRAALRLMLSNPGRIPELARLGRDSALAAKRAARVALESAIS